MRAPIVEKRLQASGFGVVKSSKKTYLWAMIANNFIRRQLDVVGLESLIVAERAHTPNLVAVILDAADDFLDLLFFDSIAIAPPRFRLCLELAQM